MRIKRLRLSSFKNLRDFEINFDTHNFTSVIVGRNGTGKSNLLEALVLIFRDLDLHESTSSLAYEIEYSCRGHEISILADPERETSRIEFTVNGEKISQKQFWDNASSEYLPRYVFGYYSGPSNRLEAHFDRHQQNFYKDLLSGAESPLRPMLYARHVHSQFVLLAFFNAGDDLTKEFLSRRLRIESFDSALFVISEPPWKSKEGDSRFWNARGFVSEFLDRLFRESLAPMRLPQRVAVDFRRNKTQDHLYLYLPDLEATREVAADYDSPQEFFKALESTYISQLLREVRVRVKLRNSDGSLAFHELSEGEQQLLTVLGLLKFTQEDESLFLLDEPDTHLNPAWSMEYINLLKEVVGDQQTSQIIMTTHDPIVLGSLHREQVRILRFEDGTDRIDVEAPEYDPFRMGYPEILTSDIFGLRSIINATLMGLLDEKRSLAIKDELTADERNRLTQLNSQIGEFDFTSSVRDPLYEPFVKAMAEAEQSEQLQGSVLTEAERERRQNLAREIIQDIVNKEASQK